MRWGDVAVTEQGVEMLNASLAGQTLTIDSAEGGSGMIDVEDMRTATGVTDKKQDLTLGGITDVDGGKKIGIQVSNADLDEGYMLHQIGIYATLPGQERKLLILLQDEDGTAIPVRTDETDFLLEVYAILAISNDADITITVDAGATATVSYVDEQIEAVKNSVTVQIDAALTSVDEKVENLQNSVDKQISSVQSSVNQQISSVQSSVNSQISSLQTDVNNQLSSMQTSIDSLHSTSVNATLVSSGWNGSDAPYTQTVNVTGLSADTNGVVSLSQSASSDEAMAAMNACLYVSGQGSGTITVSALSEKPEIDIPIAIIILA